MLKVIEINRSKMSTNIIADAKWKKTERRIDFGFLGLVVLVVAVISGVTSSNFKAQSSTMAPVSIARFSGSVIHLSLTNPHSINAKFSIKNNSQSSGIPNCTLMIQDPSGAFPGFYAQVVSHTILGGHSMSSQMSVTIAGPGLQYVTQGKIHCN